MNSCKSYRQYAIKCCRHYFPQLLPSVPVLHTSPFLHLFCIGLPPSISPPTHLSLKIFSPCSHALSAKALCSLLPSPPVSNLCSLVFIPAFNSSSCLIICALHPTSPIPFPYNFLVPILPACSLLCYYFFIFPFTYALPLIFL